MPPEWHPLHSSGFRRTCQRVARNLATWISGRLSATAHPATSTLSWLSASLRHSTVTPRVPFCDVSDWLPQETPSPVQGSDDRWPAWGDPDSDPDMSVREPHVLLPNCWPTCKVVETTWWPRSSKGLQEQSRLKITSGPRRFIDVDNHEAVRLAS